MPQSTNETEGHSVNISPTEFPPSSNHAMLLEIILESSEEIGHQTTFRKNSRYI